MVSLKAAQTDKDWAYPTTENYSAGALRSDKIIAKDWQRYAVQVKASCVLVSSPSFNTKCGPIPDFAIYTGDYSYIYRSNTGNAGVYSALAHHVAVC